MLFKRTIENQILKKVSEDKAVIIYGARRVGKTTLINQLQKNLEGKILFVSGESRSTQEWLGSRDIDKIRARTSGYNYLIVDEAQMVDEVGLSLKIVVDHIDGIKVLATGSSSFELANQVGEPLVGRKWQFHLFPISQIELMPYENKFEAKERLEERLIFGSYPEIITTTNHKEKIELLNGIVDSYLYKDLLLLENLRKPKKIIQLLKLLAFQLGGTVSISELANNLNINFNTVERYLDLLEKVFVIFPLSGFSRNLRKEVSKTNKYYFYDIGVRNAIINNFNDLSTRDDIGKLWENYLVIERLKKQHYHKIFANNYFWRTYDQQEIDLVEERDGRLNGYEFKWGEKTMVKTPQTFLDNYQHTSFNKIDKNNYLDFIT